MELPHSTILNQKIRIENPFIMGFGRFGRCSPLKVVFHLSIINSLRGREGERRREGKGEGERRKKKGEGERNKEEMKNSKERNKNERKRLSVTQSQQLHNVITTITQQLHNKLMMLD